MTGKAIGLATVVVAAVLVSGCNRRPDPMLRVQSPSEFNCLAAVSEASGSRNVTLLALSQEEEGAFAQIRADRDGTIWNCRTNLAGFVIGVGPAGGIATTPVAPPA